jgi:predicted PurR-regulated permease PerM
MPTKKMQAAPDAKELRQREKAAQATAPDEVRMKAGGTSALTAGVVVLAGLATVGALYVGKELLIPITLALVLKLLLQPVMDFLSMKLRIPAAVSAIILILCIFGTAVVVAFSISGPASSWLQKAPQVLPTLKEKLVPLRQPIEYLQGAVKELEDAATSTKDANVPQVAVKDTSAVASKLTGITLMVLGRIFTTMIVLFFLLAAGERLLRGLIEVLPRLRDKRQAVDIAAETQRQIGGYLVTITVMNTLVGLLTGLAMWACGLGDPVLWGAAAFVLNYIPILGPATGVALFFVTGLVALDWPWQALLPAVLYLLIHICEGEIITPMLLAKRFTLNPVLVIVSLFFWHTLWGVPGALLAVPLLAMFKILCDRVEALKPVGHIIGA